MQIFGQEIDKKKGMILLGVIVAGVAVVVWVRSRGSQAGDAETATEPGMDFGGGGGGGISVPAPNQGIADQYNDLLGGNQGAANQWGGRELTGQQRATAAIWGATQTGVSPDGDPILMGNSGPLYGPGAGVISGVWQQIEGGWLNTGGKNKSAAGQFLSEESAQFLSDQNKGPYAKSGKKWYEKLGSQIMDNVKQAAQIYAASQGVPLSLGGGQSRFAFDPKSGQIGYSPQRVGTPGVGGQSGSSPSPRAQGRRNPSSLAQGRRTPASASYGYPV